MASPSPARPARAFDFDYRSPARAAELQAEETIYAKGAENGHQQGKRQSTAFRVFIFFSTVEFTAGGSRQVSA